MSTDSSDPVLSLELRDALAKAGPLSLETAEKVADEMIADGRAYALEQARQNNIPEEDALAMLVDSRDAIVMMLMGTTTLDEAMEATKRIGAHHGAAAAKRYERIKDAVAVRLYNDLPDQLRVVFSDGDTRLARIQKGQSP